MNKPVVIISSTIAPPNIEHYGGVHRHYDSAARLQQTRDSIRSLLGLGIDEIYVADNSGENRLPDMEEHLRPAHVQVFNHHQYRNKGISELYLLLAALPKLPPGRPIIKLSGRYQFTRRLDEELGDADFAVWERRGLSLENCSISSIAYVVRDAATYERFLNETLRDVFGFQSRIVGPRSLLRILRNSLFPKQDVYPYDDPGGSIEHAAWRVLRKYGYRVHILDSLGVNGLRGQTGAKVVE